MKISDYIQSKLDAPPHTDGKSALYWIMIGIKSGQIVGEEIELADLIRKRVSPPDMECIQDVQETSVCGLLFPPTPPSNPLVNESIIYALRVLFTINPLALIKSIPLEEGKKTISVFTKIGTSEIFTTALYPELSAFIRHYAHELNEEQLLLIAHALHNNKQLIKELMAVLPPSPTPGSSKLERDTIAEELFEEAIRPYWHPLHSGNSAYFYADFPEIEMWRLFMDAAQQNTGWAIYESREPGCINQLYQAWLFLQGTSERPLTPEFFKEIHAISSKGIIVDEHYSTTYRKCQPSYDMSFNSTTLLGYRYHHELSAICLLQKHSVHVSFIGESCIPTDELDETIRGIIAEYELHSAANKEKKDPRALLKDIILFCKKLVLIHPFSDCNGRLFCNLLLNRELIRHGFSPTLLDNPNRFDGWSPDELLSEVVRGMINFQTLKSDPLFKDGRTLEFMKEQTYPIPDIARKLSIGVATEGTSTGCGFFSSTMRVDDPRPADPASLTAALSPK